MQKQNNKRAILLVLLALLIGLFFGRTLYEKIMGPGANATRMAPETAPSVPTLSAPTGQDAVPDHSKPELRAETAKKLDSKKHAAGNTKPESDDPAPKGTVFFDEKN